MSELNIFCISRNSMLAVAAQLRLVAEQLEHGNIDWKSGGISVGANHSGEMTISSDLVLQCREQPTVDEPTFEKVEEITLYSPVQEAVFETLLKMESNEKKCLTFDHGEVDQVNEWSRVIRNKGEYPLSLSGRVYEVTPFRNSAELGIWIRRLV